MVLFRIGRGLCGNERGLWKAERDLWKIERSLCGSERGLCGNERNLYRKRHCLRKIRRGFCRKGRDLTENKGYLLLCSAINPIPNKGYQTGRALLIEDICVILAPIPGKRTVIYDFIEDTVGSIACKDTLLLR